MSGWTERELDAIGSADELRISARRLDGTMASPVPIWVVRVRGDLYVRSYRGTDGSWYRQAARSGQGHVEAGGVKAEVRLIAPGAEVTDAIDAAYRTKYSRYGSAYVGPMTADAARAATLRLEPADGA